MANTLTCMTPPAPTTDSDAAIDVHSGLSRPRRALGPERGARQRAVTQLAYAKPHRSPRRWPSARPRGRGPRASCAARWPSGRVIPVNRNHPESEPAIIGKSFLVKINANWELRGHSSIEEEVDKMVWRPAGRRHDHGLSTASGSTRPASGACATRRCRSATVPIYQALEKVNGDPRSCPGRSIGTP